MGRYTARRVHCRHPFPLRRPWDHFIATLRRGCGPHKVCDVQRAQVLLHGPRTDGAAGSSGDDRAILLKRPMAELRAMLQQRRLETKGRRKQELVDRLLFVEAAIECDAVRFTAPRFDALEPRLDDAIRPTTSRYESRGDTDSDVRERSSLTMRGRWSSEMDTF